jgi:hypothetical protein
LEGKKLIINFTRKKGPERKNRNKKMIKKKIKKSVSKRFEVTKTGKVLFAINTAVIKNFTNQNQESEDKKK